AGPRVVGGRRCAAPRRRAEHASRDADADGRGGARRPRQHARVRSGRAHAVAGRLGRSLRAVPPPTRRPWRAAALAPRPTRRGRRRGLPRSRSTRLLDPLDRPPHVTSGPPPRLLVAGRAATACFLLAALTAIGLAVVYALGGQAQLEGALLGVALLTLGTGLILWAHHFLARGPFEEHREKLASSELEREEFEE